MTLFHTCCETVHRSGGGRMKVNERKTVLGGWLATRLAVDFSTVGGDTRVSPTCVPPPQPWREIDAHAVDSTLNNWLIELTVCLLNGFVFTWTLFRAKFEFKGKHSHRPGLRFKLVLAYGALQMLTNYIGLTYRSISSCQEQLPGTLRFCMVVWRRYLGEVGKFVVLCG